MAWYADNTRAVHALAQPLHLARLRTISRAYLMKTRPACPILNLKLISMALCTAFALAVDAAPPVGDPGQSDGKAKSTPTIQDRPIIEPRVPTGGEVPGKGKMPELPERAGKKQASQPVKDLVGKFQNARESYLAEQMVLKEQLKTATEEQREAIRQQIRDSLDRWKERHREFAEEAKESAQRIKDQLAPEMKRVIENGINEGRGR